jgi:tripartite-type tricarboxylate transporter receptor subunit TctC
MSFAACVRVSIAAIVLGFASAAHADFPDRAIKIESGFPAGGGADILIRWYAEKLRELTGQPVVVENKPGAGGNLGTDALVKSKPDGYTIMMAPSSAIAGNIYLYKNLPFNLRTDIVPIVTLAQLAFVLTINPEKTPAKNVAEFVTLMKAKNGRATYGSPTTTASACAALLMAAAGFEAIPVAYKAMAAAVSDVAAGQIDFVMADAPFALTQEKQGKVKVLAATSAQRSTAFPQVPTLAEEGIKGAELAPWWAAYAPAKTPPEVIAKYADWINKINTMADTREYLIKQGMEPLPGTSAATKERLAADIERWAKIVEIAKLEAQ